MSRARAAARGREKVLILDFGSQYTQLIARRVRELGVYSEIVPGTTPAAEIAARAPAALILSGSPASGYRAAAPMPDPGIYALERPLLGICYGFQATMQLSGGEVKKAPRAEYGMATFVRDQPSPLFDRVPKRFRAWMSHGDEVVALPAGWTRIAHTANCRFAAARHQTLPFHLIQFHPEVVHSPYGKQVLENFLFRIAGLEGGWSMKSFLRTAIADIRARVKDGRVLCGLSGGVDSTVVATLCHRAIGDRLTCVLVDHGLLREGEVEEVTRELGRRRQLDVVVVDARQRFLDALAGVTDPEQKRRIIGAEFIAVFEAEARRLQGAKGGGAVEFLAQGTLYPDVIESASAGHGAQVIKTHHNVGGLPERMALKLIEPLRWLFKDEVRALGRELGLPPALVDRHPFPGPGSARAGAGQRPRPRAAAPRRRDLHRGAAALRLVRAHLAGVRGAAAAPDRRGQGRRALLREDRGAARGRQSGRHDRRLDAAAVEPGRAGVEPHRQRGARRQSRGLRLHQQAAGHHRMGVSR